MTEIIKHNGKEYRKCTEEDLKFISKARNEASKPANFAILYSGGVAACAGPITKTFPNMSEAEVLESAKKVLKSKKGYRPRGSDNYVGGSWSKSFNMMRKISLDSAIPELPCLKGKISTALRPNAVGTKFVPGRLNFSIQGSGTEILASFIVMVDWLAKYHKVVARFVVSIHDEVVFMAKEEDAQKMVFIFQQAHFLTWTLFHNQMGLYEMPIQRAYFSGVAIDDIVRKSPYEKTTTISNPEGDSIPSGKEYTIRDVIQWENERKEETPK